MPVLALAVDVFGCAPALANATDATPTPTPSMQDDGTCGNLENVVNVLWVEGRVTTWPSRCDRETAISLTAARELAARDLACPIDAVNTAASAVDARIRVAEGCGRRAAYFFYTAGYDRSRSIPNYEGHTVYSHIHLLTRMTPERAAAALAGVNAFIARTGTKANSPSADDYLTLYTKLVEAGARDLHCPTGDVIPMLSRLSPSAQVPVAEGSGFRATYLPIGFGNPVLLLSSVVRIAARAD
jgi:hypothetical protein